MQLMSISQLLMLLLVANGAPVLAKDILGRRLGRALDGGANFYDGRPIFGKSKTIRGVVVAVLASAGAAPLLLLDWRVGTLVGSIAMAGDLFSSFVKRRMGLMPSSRAIGLDQIPESLLPALACRVALSLTMWDIFAVVALFCVGEVVLSRILYKYHLRDRPY